MRRVAFATLGCKANQFDTAAVQDAVGDAVEWVDFRESADVYVLNTCTVTHRADADARQLIRRAKRQNPGARVIVTGCYAQTQPEAVAAVNGVDQVVGNSHKDRLPQMIVDDASPGAPEVMVDTLGFKQKIPPLPDVSGAGSKTRAFVKIQDGCDYACSFCIITVARGANASVPVAEVVRQIRDLTAVGVHEVVLTGVQIGRYGRDLNTPTNLTKALRQILAETDMPRIRLSSIDPREFTAELIDLVATESRICPHLHIPIQSGDDAILLLMRRDHDRRFMSNLFAQIRDARPEVMFGSDVIVGFPGEGPSEFDMTYDFVDQWIDHVHVFPYSDRPGTKATELSDKIDPQVIARRAGVLRHLGAQKRDAFARHLVGSKQQVVVENKEVDGHHLAYTAHYIPVHVPTTLADPNTLLNCRLSWASGHLLGTPEA